VGLRKIRIELREVGRENRYEKIIIENIINEMKRRI
jgi:hypothetical protein